MSALRAERCPACGGVIATQVEDGPIHRYDEDHQHDAPVAGVGPQRGNRWKQAHS